MRTRVDGDKSGAGPTAASELHDPGLKSTAVAGAGVGPVAPSGGQRQLSSGIADYCTQFEALSDATSKKIWMFGPDGQCRYFNRSWLEFRGRTAEQERVPGWTEGMHPEDLDRCMTSYRCAFEARQPIQLEFRVKRADGAYAWIVAHAVPQYLLDGTFVGYVGSLEEAGSQGLELGHYQRLDMQGPQTVRQALCQIAANLKRSSPPPSARERARRRKRKTQVSMRVLLECLDISVTPIVVVSKRGRAVYCNGSFRALGAKASLHTRTETTSNLTQWPKGARRTSSARQIPAKARDCAPEAQAWLDSELIANPQDIRISVQPLAVAGSELTAVSIIDTKQESRTRLLEQAFLHDIVNAAGSIQMLIDLLTESTSRQERAEYVKLLQVSMNRLLSEVYHEKMMLENPGPVPSVCNIREVFESLAQYYRNHPLGRNCRIDVDTSSVQTVNVLSDQTLLVRVLDNMLRNAIEATGDGGVVTMGCRQVNGALECWVHNPNAISENIRAKIFNQPFSTKGRDRGVGTQEIKVLSELCGGTVAVSSDPEQGTTFSVRYPAAPETVSPHKRYHTRHAS